MKRKIIVGLGNPGNKYINTRHNIGFMFVDYLIELLNVDENWEYKERFKAEILEYDINSVRVTFLKPMTFMNESGWSVSQYMSWLNLNTNNLLVIHDDLDINFGSFKQSNSKGPKIHYGLNSIESYLNSNEFNRLRIGIDNRLKENPILGINYVMSNFSAEEKIQLKEIFKDSALIVEDFIKNNN